MNEKLKLAFDKAQEISGLVLDVFKEYSVNLISENPFEFAADINNGKVPDDKNLKTLSDINFTAAKLVANLDQFIGDYNKEQQAELDKLNNT